MLTRIALNARRTLLPLLLVLGGTFALGACNTMEGLGRDTQAAGQALEEEAEEATE